MGGGKTSLLSELSNYVRGGNEETPWASQHLGSGGLGGRWSQDTQAFGVQKCGGQVDSDYRNRKLQGKGLGRVDSGPIPFCTMWGPFVKGEVQKLNRLMKLWLKFKPNYNVLPLYPGLGGQSIQPIYFVYVFAWPISMYRSHSYYFAKENETAGRRIN